MLKHDIGVRELAITTNGILMGSGGGIHEGSQGSDGRMKGMALLNGLIDAGVSSFNVSLDSLQPQRFSVLSRCDSFVFFFVCVCKCLSGRHTFTAGHDIAAAAAGGRA